MENGCEWLREKGMRRNREEKEIEPESGKNRQYFFQDIQNPLRFVQNKLVC